MTCSQLASSHFPLQKHICIKFILIILRPENKNIYFFYNKSILVFMKRVLIFTLAMFFAFNIQAQQQVPAKSDAAKDTAEAPKIATSPLWKKGGEGLLSFSFTSFSNWAEGGVNATAINSNLTFFADYQKDKLTWENDLRLLFGIIRSADIGDFRKSDDIIDFDSKIGYRINEKLNWATLLEFDSQVAKGFNFDEEPAKLISKFAAPAIVRFGTGLDYKPNDWFSLYFSPATFKGVIVADQDIANLGLYGTAPGEQFKPELGGYLRADLKRELVKNVVYTTRLEVYSNFLATNFVEEQQNVTERKANGEEEVLDEAFVLVENGRSRPGSIDVIWMNSLNLKVNKYITTTFDFQLKYDREVDVDPNNTWVRADGSEGQIIDQGLQTRTFFGVGLSYQF